MVTSQREPATRTRIDRCTHHWKVSPPQGELSWGQCAKCGKRKRFSNRFEGRDRSNNSDLFTEGRVGLFKPDRRHTYYDAGREALDEARAF